MNFVIGNYEIETDIDPMIQNNASDERVPIENIGFVYNCVFKQKRAFEHSVDAIKEVYPDAKIYHYNHYEITTLERLTSIFKVHGVDYDHYLNLGKFVDLFKIVKQAVYVSQKSYSLKDIEKYYDFMNMNEFIYNDDESYDDLIASNRAVFRVVDPRNENNQLLFATKEMISR